MLLLRNIAAIALCVAIASCQWSPVYAPSGQNATHALPPLYISSANDKRSRTLRHALEDALPNHQSAASTPWVLDITQQMRHYPVGIENDGQPSRFNVVAISDITLSHNDTTVIDDKIKRIASYSVVDSDFATYLAREQTEERVMNMLAEAIRDRVMTAMQGDELSKQP